MSINTFSTVIIVAKDEWRYWLRSKLAMTVLVIGLLLTLTSVIVTAFTMMESKHTRLALQKNSEQSFVEQPDRHPHRMVHYGHYAFRTPSPLSSLDPGIDGYTGNAIFLEGHRQNSAMFADQRQGTALTKLGSLTPAFIVQTLAPLLLILMGYSAISRERESQTLSYLLSQGTAGLTLIAGKGLALLSIVGLILTPLALSALMTLSAGESLLAVVSFIVGYTLYLTAWVLMILLASSVFTNNSGSFTALAFIWILLCIVMPRLASTMASTQVSSPGKIATDFAVKAQLRKLGDGHNANDPAFEQLKAALLNKYQVDSIEQLPVNFKGVVARESEAKLTHVLNQFAEQRMQAELKQTQLARHFGWVSPMVAIRSLSMLVVGTSIETHHRFLRETEQLRFDFVQRLNNLHAEKLSYQDDINRYANETAAQKARVSAQNWQLLQNFSFTTDSATLRAQRSVWAYLQLALWIVGLLGAIKYVGKRLL
jgi:ABC-2 type transport system permease protein